MSRLIVSLASPEAVDLWLAGRIGDAQLVASKPFLSSEFRLFVIQVNGVRALRQLVRLIGQLQPRLTHCR